MSVQSVLRPLSQDWSFTQVGGGQGTKQEEWLPVSSFPTTVHVELLSLKKIPDPFVGLNEWNVQWIGEAEWAFKTSFSVTEQEAAAPNVDLVFDGLDTFATVTLNGSKILETDNQFVVYRASAKQHLKVGANELSITFPSAFLKGRELEKEHGKLALWNGDSSRLHVRKAQYNYGWDWGPVLMTVGPWRPISLHIYQTRITDFRVSSIVDANLEIDLTASVTLSSDVSSTADIALKHQSGSVVLSKKFSLDKGSAKAKLDVKKGDVELWYPVGHGKQPIYEVVITVSDEQGNVLDSKVEKIGFRRAIVVEDELVDQAGRTFLFEINNARTFIGGSCWIPADSFITTISAERYREWLQLLVDGNQNMIRVWGGGIYEQDVFYDLCDELGILVWQDFAFGCGQYPAYDSFLDTVKVEAEQNVQRLRHHPSIVIFTGNNEDYQVAEQTHLELDYNDEKSDFRKTNFPARHIYERVLPAIVEEHSDIHYHRSSPYSGYGKPTTDQEHGDIHQWNVWHGSQEPWHNWDKLAGRFVSEFGMEAYPDIRTVDYWTGGDKAERYPQSRISVNHNKADGFERRLELYLMENFKHAFDMESYVYYTQVMQAETLASAYRLWRRNWRGKGREYTAGALVWQINDCWPVTSWAIIDYFLRPKPSYFTIARELRPLTVGMTRKEKKVFADEHTAAHFTITSALEIWGTNSTYEEKHATLQVTSFDLEKPGWQDQWEKKIVLAPNSSTELWKGEVPGQPVRTTTSEVPKDIVVSARLLGEDGAVLSRYSNWPEPFKYIHFPAVEDLGFKIATLGDGESVELSTLRPIKGVVLDAEGDFVKWSDQAIDLVPGDPQVIKAVGLKGRAVKARFLGDGSA
ncbi:glycoside hydrolase family 2 protein [Auriscalpium vulgare]|uniref:Glycoside hydrolase family 2 protein n=1 Tax=Auriscalpium vulgare TaxID=40419 RepID=A0ACB8SBJ0_9AGAM|nr:glycoside hydrolase family 2 protein [Auriscalpium vulgare]